jgi:hypothetical protein
VDQLLRIARPTKVALIALVVVWVIMALFVLANVSEDVRGDSYFLPFVHSDFVVGAKLTAVILGVDVLARFLRRLAKLP